MDSVDKYVIRLTSRLISSLPVFGFSHIDYLSHLSFRSGSLFMHSSTRYLAELQQTNRVSIVLRPRFVFIASLQTCNIDVGGKFPSRCTQITPVNCTWHFCCPITLDTFPYNVDPKLAKRTSQRPSANRRHEPVLSTRSRQSCAPLNFDVRPRSFWVESFQCRPLWQTASRACKTDFTPAVHQKTLQAILPISSSFLRGRTMNSQTRRPHQSIEH